MTSADGSRTAGFYGDELGHANPIESARLKALTAAFDQDTVRRLNAVIGVHGEWHCLEVGAGTGTIAQWLARRCPRGETTATDVDLSLLPADQPPRLKALVHDVTRDDFPEGSFNVIHARFVLMHLPERDDVVRRMLSWLAPGGTLLIEELVDFPCHSLPPGDPVRRSVVEALKMLRASYGLDDNWGARAPEAFRAAGFADVQAEASLPTFHAGAPVLDFWRLTLVALTPHLVERGVLTSAQIEEALAALAHPDHLSFPLGVIAVRGRRP
ncbi:methyltransferase [Streptomyces sp. NPDC001941]|uniref:methyltransferase n=1 Tax=Streptomyces sp. NPDC001941 TaxID=3154659 RepID=UPI00331EC94E